MRSTSSQRGFALAGAIFALVVIASLIAGAFFAARQEMSMGRSSQTYQRAFDAAEAGLGQTIATWNSGLLNAMTVGTEEGPFPHQLPGNTGFGETRVKRLNDQLYLISTTGLDRAGSARRTLAALARLQRLALDVQAGLTTQGRLQVGGSSQISGRDQDPAGWACAPPTGDVLPGVLMPPDPPPPAQPLLDISGCPHGGCLDGDPPDQRDNSIDNNTFFTYGDLDWNELVSMATKTVASGTQLTQIEPSRTQIPNSAPARYVCNYSDARNWGEPGVTNNQGQTTFPEPLCRYYFPIIYAQGNLGISQGRGQGILLVEGDLTVQGGFEFYGPVIVRGTLNTGGQGGHFNGGVLAANVNFAQSQVLGDALIGYSSCAIESALNYAMPARLLAQRSWAELTR